MPAQVPGRAGRSPARAYVFMMPPVPHWAWTVVVVGSALIGLYGLHRVLCWLEGRGYVYYRNARGGAGAALAGLAESFQPHAAAHVEVQQEQEERRDDDDDDEGDGKGDSPRVSAPSGRASARRRDRAL